MLPDSAGPSDRAVTRNPTTCSGPEPAPAPEPGATLSRRRPSNSSSSEPMSPGRTSNGGYDRLLVEAMAFHDSLPLLSSPG